MVAMLEELDDDDDDGNGKYKVNVRSISVI